MTMFSPVAAHMGAVWLEMSDVCRKVQDEGEFGRKMDPITNAAKGVRGVFK